MQRHETSQRDPAMVVFDRYAFDLSQFAGGAQAVKYSIRERYLWQLLFPDPNDQFYVEQPDQFRAELHDRLMAPLYPIAFVVIAYAYLGAPRTTRAEPHDVACLAPSVAWQLLRLIGFASTVFGADRTLDAVAAIRCVGCRIRRPGFTSSAAVSSSSRLLSSPTWLDCTHRAPAPALRYVLIVTSCRSRPEHWHAISGCAF